MNDNEIIIMENGMTVKDLISILSDCDPELSVYLSTEGVSFSWCCTCIDTFDSAVNGCITLSNELKDVIEDMIEDKKECEKVVDNIHERIRELIRYTQQQNESDNE